VQVTRGSITSTIVMRGRVMSAREVALSFPIDGQLRALTIQPGAQVKKDDLLAELDAWSLETEIFNAQNEVDLLQAQLNQAQTLYAQQVATAKADLEVAKAQDAVSALERDKIDRQIREGKVTHGQVEEDLIRDLTARAALDKARLAQAQARFDSVQVNAEIPLLTERLRIAKAKLERLQSRLAVAQLRAPFDGTIVALDAQIGDSLKAYQKIGVIADPTQLILVANVFEDDIPYVSVGQAAVIKIDAYPTRPLTGRVSQVGLQPISMQGKIVYEVKIMFDASAEVPPAIRQGADVSIAVHSKPDMLLVPNQAVIQEGSKMYVQVVRGGSVFRTPVQLGLSDGISSVVIFGLQEGDVVKMP